MQRHLDWLAAGITHAAQGTSLSHMVSLRRGWASAMDQAVVALDHGGRNAALIYRPQGGGETRIQAWGEDQASALAALAHDLIDYHPYIWELHSVEAVHAKWVKDGSLLQHPPRP